MGEQLESLKTNLRSILMIEKNGIDLLDLNAKYKGLTNVNIAYDSKYRTLKSFLESIPDTVEITSHDGQTICTAVCSQKQTALQRLIQQQKSGLKKLPLLSQRLPSLQDNYVRPVSSQPIIASNSLICPPGKTNKTSSYSRRQSTPAANSNGASNDISNGISNGTSYGASNGTSNSISNNYGRRSMGATSSYNAPAFDVRAQSGRVSVQTFKPEDAKSQESNQEPERSDQRSDLESNRRSNARSDQRSDRRSDSRADRQSESSRRSSISQFDVRHQNNDEIANGRNSSGPSDEHTQTERPNKKRNSESRSSDASKLDIRENDSGDDYKSELSEYAKEYDLPQPRYATLTQVEKRSGNVIAYFSKVQLDDRCWLTFPVCYSTSEGAENGVAKKALDELRLQANSSNGQEADLPTQVTVDCLLHRLVELIGDRTLFKNAVEKEYLAKFGHQLESSWLKLVEDSKAFDVQKIQAGNRVMVTVALSNSCLTGKIRLDNGGDAKSTASDLASSPVTASGQHNASNDQDDEWKEVPKNTSIEQKTTPIEQKTVLSNQKVQTNASNSDWDDDEEASDQKEVQKNVSTEQKNTPIEKETTPIAQKVQTNASNSDWDDDDELKEVQNVSIKQKTTLIKKETTPIKQKSTPIEQKTVSSNPKVQTNASNSDWDSDEDEVSDQKDDKGGDRNEPTVANGPDGSDLSELADQISSFSLDDKANDADNEEEVDQSRRSEEAGQDLSSNDADAPFAQLKQLIQLFTGQSLFDYAVASEFEKRFGQTLESKWFELVESSKFFEVERLQVGKKLMVTVSLSRAYLDGKIKLDDSEVNKPDNNQRSSSESPKITPKGIPKSSPEITPKNSPKISPKNSPRSNDTRRVCKDLTPLMRKVKTSPSKDPNVASNGKAANRQQNDHQNDLASSCQSKNDKLQASKYSQNLPDQLSFDHDNDWPVMLLSVTNWREITVRLTENTDQLDELIADLNQFYCDDKLGVPVKHLILSKVYVAVFQDTVFRVLAMLQQNDQVHCYFLDDGVYEKIPKANLQEIDDRFLRLPFQAFKVQLDGLQGMSESLFRKYFDEILRSEDAQCFLARPTSRDPIIVRLFDTRTDNDVDVNADLLNYIRIHGKILFGCSKSVRPCELPDKLKTDDGHRVIVSMAACPNSFIVRSATMYQQEYKRMEAQLEQVYSNQDEIIPLNSTMVYPGLFVAAKHEDGKWYRARVQDVLCAEPDRSSRQETKYSVLLIDIGQTVVVALRNVQPLYSQFMELPTRVTRASLNGLLPNGDRYDGDTIRHFQKLMNQEQFKAHDCEYVMIDSETYVLMDLEDIDGRSMVKEMANEMAKRRV